jgi:hypothetical protein
MSFGVPKLSASEENSSSSCWSLVRTRPPRIVAVIRRLGATVRTNPAVAATLIAPGANPKEQNANRFELVVPILPVRNIL